LFYLGLVKIFSFLTGFYIRLFIFDGL